MIRLSIKVTNSVTQFVKIKGRFGFAPDQGPTPFATRSGSIWKL